GAAPAKACVVCGKGKAAGVKLRRCAGCRNPQVVYCSDACCKQHWKLLGHKAACLADQRRRSAAGAAGHEDARPSSSGASSSTIGA
ncbi:hypothetical protein MNEG_16413, partial [Monoraphidium neglectum]